MAVTVYRNIVASITSELPLAVISMADVNSISINIIVTNYIAGSQDTFDVVVRESNELGNTTISGTVNSVQSAGPKIEMLTPKLGGANPPQALDGSAWISLCYKLTGTGPITADIIVNTRNT